MICLKIYLSFYQELRPVNNIFHFIIFKGTYDLYIMLVFNHYLYVILSKLLIRFRFIPIKGLIGINTYLIRLIRFFFYT